MARPFRDEPGATIAPAHNRITTGPDHRSNWRKLFCRRLGEDSFFLNFSTIFRKCAVIGFLCLQSRRSYFTTGKSRQDKTAVRATHKAHATQRATLSCITDDGTTPGCFCCVGPLLSEEGSCIEPLPAAMSAPDDSESLPSSQPNGIEKSSSSSAGASPHRVAPCPALKRRRPTRRNQRTRLSWELPPTRGRLHPHPHLQRAMQVLSRHRPYMRPRARDSRNKPKPLHPQRRLRMSINCPGLSCSHLRWSAQTTPRTRTKMKMEHLDTMEMEKVTKERCPPMPHRRHIYPRRTQAELLSLPAPPCRSNPHGAWQLVMRREQCKVVELRRPDYPKLPSRLLAPLLRRSRHRPRRQTKQPAQRLD